MATLTGDNGLLQKAQTAKEKQDDAKELELIKLAVSAAQVAGEGTIEEKVLNDELIANLGGTDTANKVGENWYYKGYVIEGNGNVKKYDKVLPKEYQQVEYIESSGTQWIDTGIIGNSNIGIKAVCSLSEIYSYEDKNIPGYFFGVCSDGDTRVTSVICETNGSLIKQFGYGKYYNNQFQMNIQKNAFYTYYSNYNDDGFFAINNTGKTILTDFTGTEKLYLFTYNFRGKNVQSIIGKIKSCSITINNDIVRNFIPCYYTTIVTDVNGKQCSKDTIGLYDTVEGKFYVNKGTGTFGYETDDGTYVAPTNN